MALVFLTAALVFASPVAAGAAKTRAQIVDGRVRLDGGAYLLSFRVDGAFTPDLNEAVQAGIPTTFTYFFRVHRDLPGFFDEKVFEFQVRRTIHYDAIRRTFTVLFGEKGVTETYKDAGAAKSAMTRFADLPIAVLASIPSVKGYSVAVKAQMEKAQLPLPFGLENLFFFSALWDFETSWTRIDIPERAETMPAPPAAGPPADSGNAP